MKLARAAIASLAAVAARRWSDIMALRSHFGADKMLTAGSGGALTTGPLANGNLLVEQALLVGDVGPHLLRWLMLVSGFPYFAQVWLGSGPNEREKGERCGLLRPLPEGRVPKANNT